MDLKQDTQWYWPRQWWVRRWDADRFLGLQLRNAVTPWVNDNKYVIANSHNYEPYSSMNMTTRGSHRLGSRDDLGHRRLLGLLRLEDGTLPPSHADVSISPPLQRVFGRIDALKRGIAIATTATAVATTTITILEAHTRDC